MLILVKEVILMFEKLKAKRAFNKDIDNIYKKYKKCEDETKKVDNRTFKQALGSFYAKKGKNTKYENYFEYCLETRYEIIKSSYESLFGLAVSWLSAFIPTIMLCEFSQNMFSGVSWYNVLLAAVVALALMMICMTLAFSIGSALILPWIFYLYPKKTYKKYNIEMKEIAAYWSKNDIITHDNINIKNLFIKFAITGISAMALNAITLIIFWIICNK